MVAHRYWRIMFLRPSDTYLAALAEIELREAAGGPNVAPSASVTAPGGSSYPASNLVDGSSSSFWQATQVGADSAIEFDFGSSPRDIAEVRIIDIPTNSVQRINGAMLQYSDGQQWKTIGCQLLPTGLPLGGAVTTAVNSAVLANGLLLRKAILLGTVFPLPSRRVLPRLFKYDAVDGGMYYVAGAVQIDATPDMPVSRRVRLFEALTARIVRETWSAADGSYIFTKIRFGQYFVTAHDHTLEYNSVIRDRIDSVPMP